MLKRDSLGATLISPVTIGDAAVQSGKGFDESAYHRDDDLSELALLQHEIGELRREIREARDKLDDSLRLARLEGRVRSAAQARRERRTKGGALARAILSLMVAVFTLGGVIAGIGVGVTVIHVWGGSAVVALAAAVFGLAVTMGAWLLAALAAIVLETADSVRNLPA